jgi:Trk K+ transport system NAD-binding subunit
LRRVHVQAAHAVILLAESTDASEDAGTILSILAVRKICSNAQSKKSVAIIAEINDPQNVELATYAGTDRSVALEVVSAHKVGEGLLSHAAVHPGLSKVYAQLLAFSKDHSEIHRTRVPESLVGKAFDVLVASAVEKRPNGTYVLPIAIQRGSEVYINPTPPAQGEDWLLQQGDYLYAICDSPQDLKELYHPNPKGLLRRLVQSTVGGFSDLEEAK